MMRWDVIKAVAAHQKSRAYLEIGCNFDETFGQVPVKFKVGVDNERGGNFRCTSDQFFGMPHGLFDLIFVDGDHHLVQVTRDFCNAWECLTNGGLLCLHDSYPPQEEAQRWDVDCGMQCGDVWKLVAALKKLGVNLITVPENFGVTVVMPYGPCPSFDDLINTASTFSWKDFSDQVVGAIDPSDLEAMLPNAP